ncbi:MAG: winged helix-turn-helix transcriptional regulator [Alphaproteobacteria bacterium]
MNDRSSERPAGGALEARDNQVILGVLEAVSRESRVTQRQIAGELGIALGLANEYVRRCLRKGLIKIRTIPRRRYAYYLTPHGFAEKARLTAEYLSDSFALFRRARNDYTVLMAEAQSSGRTRLALAGASDLAEIARLCAIGATVEIVGVVEPGATEPTFHGLPLTGALDQCGPVDAVILTAMRETQAVYDRLVAEVGADRVLVPAFLDVDRARPVQPDATDAP